MEKLSLHGLELPDQFVGCSVDLAVMMAVAGQLTQLKDKSQKETAQVISGAWEHFSGFVMTELAKQRPVDSPGFDGQVGMPADVWAAFCFMACFAACTGDISKASEMARKLVISGITESLQGEGDFIQDAPSANKRTH